MEEIIKYLQQNFLKIDKIDKNILEVELPMTTIGGELLTFRIYKDDNLFFINDKGMSIDVVNNVIVGVNEKNIRSVKNVVNESIVVFNSNNLKIDNIRKEGLPFALTTLAEFSLKFSNCLYDKVKKEKDKQADMKDEIEDKLKCKYKDKFRKNYKILGESKKSYEILFEVENDNNGIRYIETTTGNTNNVANLFMKYSDIKKQDNLKKEIILLEDDMDSSNSTLLGKVADSIREYKNFVA